MRRDGDQFNIVLRMTNNIVGLGYYVHIRIFWDGSYARNINQNVRHHSSCTELSKKKVVKKICNYISDSWEICEFGNLYIFFLQVKDDLGWNFCRGYVS